MNDTGLSKTAAALRERYPGTSANAAASEARILARVRQRRAVRRRHWAWSLPVAAVLAVSTAWADPAGLLPRLLRSARAWLGSDAALPVAAPRPTPQGAVPRGVDELPHRPPSAGAHPITESTAAGAASSSVGTAQAPSPPVPRAAQSNLSSMRRTAPNATAQLAEPARSGAGDTELYRAAHRLHFGGGSGAAVLAAWNRYLEAAPHGAFVLEARYNRALTQLRLGLNREARNSLVPFARGEYGPYRQAEARALIQRLEGR